MLLANWFRPMFLGMLCTTLMTACSSDSERPRIAAETPLTEPVEPAGAFGPFSVGHMTGQEFDASRDNRSLPYDVWYPAQGPADDNQERTLYPLQGPIGISAELAVDDLPVAGGDPLPLLVFSHGSGGINIQSIRMMEALASHGFIVVSPSHTGNTSSDFSDSLAEAGARRVPDISFMLDVFLGRNESPGDAFHQRIDADRIGVLGHSFGGGTALGMVAGFYGAAADHRVQAVMPISATVLERFTDEALAAVTEPVLFLGGTEDTSVPIENHDYGFDKLSSSNAVFQVDIVGAGHNHFAAICDIGNTLIDNGLGQDIWPAIGAEALLAPYAETCGETAYPIDEAQRIQNVYGVAFFRRYLLGQEEYDYYLRSEYAEENEPDVNYRDRVDR